MDHSAKWDLISSMVSSSLKGSPICSGHSSQHHSGKGSLFRACAAYCTPFKVLSIACCQHSLGPHVSWDCHAL